MKLLLTCEHGGNRVPAKYRAAFAGAARALDSHRGWDAGALTLARQLAHALDAPLLDCTTTRLLVDTNRSRRHPRLFSEWSRDLPRAERDEIVTRWWDPHRTAVEEFIRSHARRGRPVLHVSVHSFTPRLEGVPREVDVGFLYDPARSVEQAFAIAWQRSLRTHRAAQALRLRRNQPYRGNADGLTTSMRKLFAEQQYAGVELEVSQRFPRGPLPVWNRLRRDILESLRETASARALVDGFQGARRGTAARRARAT